MSKLLTAALEYAGQGFEVFPLTPLSKIPLKGTAGSKEATTDKDKITSWWTNQPKANIGLVTKKFLVLDIDVHDEDKNGFKSLEVLQDTFEPLPKTKTVQTANEGLHIYLLKPEGVELPQKIAMQKGVDVKAHPNNYIVAPPSIIKRGDGSTGSYAVQYDAPIALCPQWLIGFMLRHEPKPDSQHKNATEGSRKRYKNRTTYLLETLANGAETGSRNDTAAKVVGLLLTFGVTVKTAWKLVQFMNDNSDEPLEQKELETTFSSICKKELRA